MKLYMLIILCFCSPKIQGIHHDQNYNRVEEKAMEKDDQQFAFNIVKRAISDNNLGGNNVHEIVTTHDPSNTLEYISSEQTVTESGVDVTVLPLEETTKSKNLNATIYAEKINVTSITGNINPTEQTANFNNVNDNGTEDSVNTSRHPSTSSYVSKEPILPTNTSLTPNYGNTTNSTERQTQDKITILNNTTFSSQVTNAGTETVADITINPTGAVSPSVTQSSSEISNHNNSESESPKTLQGKNDTSTLLSNSPDSMPFSTPGTLIHTNITSSTERITTTQSSNFIKSVTDSGISNTSVPSVSVTTALFIDTSSSDIVANATADPSPHSGSILLTSPMATRPVSELPTLEPAVPTFNTTNAPPPASIIEDDKGGPEPETTADTVTYADNEIPVSEPEPSPTPSGTVDESSPKDNNDTILVEPESNENRTTAVPANKPSEPSSIPETGTINQTSESDKPSTSTTTVAFTSNVNTPTSEPATYTPTSQTRMETPSTEQGYSNSTSTTLKAEPTETPISEPETELNITSGTDKPTGTSKPETYTPTPESDNGDPTTEPETYTPTSEPAEDDSNSEPDVFTESPVKAEPEFNFDVFAEPGPDWPVAKIAWKQAWEFHIYFFGVAFVLLGLYCLFCVIQLWKMDHLISKHYFMTLQVLVMLICIFRASYLLIDAYNSMGTFPIVLDYFLYSTVFPCLTAVFSILFYALLLAIRVRVISEKVQKLWVLLLIIGLHFALSFATDIIVGLFSTAAIMLLICQSFFILWGLIIFVGYLVIFKRLYTSAINRQEAMKRNNTHERKNNITQGFQEKLPKQNYRLGLAVKVTLVCSFFGLACVCFELYGMFGVYGITRVDKPQPWPWWIYHFILRSLEIMMCSSIAYVASQPLKYTYKKKYKDHACLKALPCRYLCCADTSSHRDEGSMNMDECVVSETDHLGWLKKLKLKKFCSPDGSAPYPPHTAEKYTDPDATLLVRKIHKARPSMLVVEEGFVRIRRDDEMVPANQYDLDSISMSSRASDMNNVSALPDVSFTINKRQTQHELIAANSSGVSNAAFAQEDNRLGLQDGIRMSVHGDNRISFQGDIETQDDFADDTDIDIAVTDCDENSDGYDSPVSVSDDNLGNSGDIFRPLSAIDLAASMESELERAFHTSHADEADTNMKHETPGKGARTYKNDLKDPRLGGQGHTDDDWSDSSDGPNRTPDAGLLRRPIRRCKSAESKEQQKSKMFDKNKYFSLSSIDSIGKHEVQSTDSEQP